MRFDENNFKITTRHKLDSDPNRFSEFLKNVFIASVSEVNKYTSLDGFVRDIGSPDGNGTGKLRCTFVNNDLMPRVSAMYNTYTYLSNNGLLIPENFRYVTIEYKGSSQKEWQEYSNQIMDFIDYILPYLKDHIDQVTIDHIIYADHAFPKDKKVKLFIVYTSDEPTEFEQLWKLYLEYIDQK